MCLIVLEHRLYLMIDLPSPRCPFTITSSTFNGFLILAHSQTYYFPNDPLHTHTIEKNNRFLFHFPYTRIIPFELKAISMNEELVGRFLRHNLIHQNELQ